MGAKPPALHLTFTFSISGANFPVWTDHGTFIAVLTKMIDRATNLENTLKNSIYIKKSKATEILLKKLSLCHKLKFSNLYIFATMNKPLIFQTWIFYLAEIIVWIINGLRHWFAKKYGLENQILLQRLKSFRCKNV